MSVSIYCQPLIGKYKGQNKRHVFYVSYIKKPSMVGGRLGLHMAGKPMNPP